MSESSTKLINFAFPLKFTIQRLEREFIPLGLYILSRYNFKVLYWDQHRKGHNCEVSGEWFVQPIIWNWKNYGTTADLPRHGRPPKLTGPEGERSSRKSRERLTSEELPTSTAQVRKSVKRKTTRSRPKCGFCVRVARGKLLLNKSHIKSCLIFTRHFRV